LLRVLAVNINQLKWVIPLSTSVAELAHLQFDLRMLRKMLEERLLGLLILRCYIRRQAAQVRLTHALLLKRVSHHAGSGSEKK